MNIAMTRQACVGEESECRLSAERMSDGESRIGQLWIQQLRYSTLAVAEDMEARARRNRGRRERRALGVESHYRSGPIRLDRQQLQRAVSISNMTTQPEVYPWDRLQRNTGLCDQRLARA